MKRGEQIHKHILLTGRDGNPRQVEADIVTPEVERLGTAVRTAAEPEFAQARRIVERHPVQVRHAG